MSILVLCSAKGSPGVTTTAVALGSAFARLLTPAGPASAGPAAASPAVTPAAIVVEADPAGGDIAARHGMPGTPGIATLALRARRSLGPADVFDHCQPLGDGVGVLVGVAGHDQGAAVGPALERIVGALAGLDCVVVIDAGRFDDRGPLAGILTQAGAVGLVTRTTTEAALHSRSVLESLRTRGCQPGLVLVGGSGHSPRHLARALDAPLLGVVPELGPRERLRHAESQTDAPGRAGVALLALATAVAHHLEVPVPPPAPAGGSRGRVGLASTIAGRLGAGRLGAGRLGPGRLGPGRDRRLAATAAGRLS